MEVTSSEPPIENPQRTRERLQDALAQLAQAHAQAGYPFNLQRLMLTETFSYVISARPSRECFDLFLAPPLLVSLSTCPLAIFSLRLQLIYADIHRPHSREPLPGILS